MRYKQPGAEPGETLRAKARRGDRWGWSCKWAPCCLCFWIPKRSCLLGRSPNESFLMRKLNIQNKWMQARRIDSGPSPSRLGCGEDWGSLLLCSMPSSPVPPREPCRVTKEPSVSKTRAAQKLGMSVLGTLLLGDFLPACLSRAPTSSLSLGRSRVSQFYYRMLIEKAAFAGRCFLPKSLSSAEKDEHISLVQFTIILTMRNSWIMGKEIEAFPLQTRDCLMMCLEFPFKKKEMTLRVHSIKYSLTET